MTLDLAGVHICHILEHTDFKECIDIHFKPINEMKILVKIDLALCSKQTDMSLCTCQLNPREEGGGQEMAGGCRSYAV